MTLIPRIDDLACLAHGDCCDVAPGVFQVDATAVVVGDGPDDLLLAAAEACPAAAIVLVDALTGDQVYP